MKKRILIICIIIISIILALSLFFEFSANYDIQKQNVSIIANKDDFLRIKKEIDVNNNEKVIKSYGTIKSRADEIVNEPLCRYEIDEGNRMIEVSRKCKETIEILGFVTKVNEIDNETKNSKYIDRAVEELKNVSCFKDWHPEHFLDTAEMTYSVSLGYNWFYDYLTPEERELIENAIINKGLLPGISTENIGKFVYKKDNWNQVCNSSLAIGAIALQNLNKEIEVSEKNTDFSFQTQYLKINREAINDNKYRITINKLCDAIVKRAIDTIPLSYEEMQDGAYEEGITYWEYGCSYLTNFLATANINYNGTFGLIKDDIFKNTILYPVYMTGKSSNYLPQCKMFNYGDADDIIVNTACSTWLANKYYKDEKLAQIINWYQENYFDAQNVYQLLWQNYDFSLDKIEQEEKERILNSINDKRYDGTETAILQSSIIDKKGFYIATKVGNNSKTNHSDLDEGSFVLDAKGSRWIDDLGKEYYNVYKYWDKAYTRWTYYKKRTESHSTVNLNAENQRTDASCKIIDFNSNSANSSVSLDISNAYSYNENDSNTIIRKIVLDKKHNRVTIDDNINLRKEQDIYDMFNISKNTVIKLQNDNKTAVLTKEVLQEDGTYQEETLKMDIVNSNYHWIVLPKKPINNDLTDLTKNKDFKYNVENKDEEKLCIKIEKGKNENIRVEIY